MSLGDDEKRKRERRTESRVEIEHKAPQCRLPHQGSGESSIDSDGGDEGESDARDNLKVLWKGREGDGG